jgi:hypothetical protein
MTLLLVLNSIPWREATIMMIDPRNLAVIAVLTIGLSILAKKKLAVLKSNLRLMADLTHGLISFPFFGLPFYANVQGRYKGRRVTFKYLFFSRWRDLRIYIEPSGIPPTREFRLLPHEGPTDYTCTSGNKIQYVGPSGFSYGANRNRVPKLPGTTLRPLDREAIIFYLEHLATAAEIMEKSTKSQLIRS